MARRRATHPLDNNRRMTLDNLEALVPAGVEDLLPTFM